MFTLRWSCFFLKCIFALPRETDCMLLALCQVSNRRGADAFGRVSGELAPQERNWAWFCKRGTRTVLCGFEVKFGNAKENVSFLLGGGPFKKGLTHMTKGLSNCSRAFPEPCWAAHMSSYHWGGVQWHDKRERERESATKFRLQPQLILKRFRPSTISLAN